VTRLSIGVQSFRAPQLARLGRVHGPDEAARAAELARRAGFASFNLDLMYALPGDDVAGALTDLETAITLGPPHLSWYQLTLEPNTAFHRRPPPLPPEDLVLDIERRGRELLAARGYRRYEVSAYEQPGQHCVHNLNYWQFGDYLGIGAGAHGKVSFPDRVTRHERPKPPASYLKGEAMKETRVAPAELPFEFMLNALRLVEGFPSTLFQERTGLPLATISRSLKSGEEKGLLEHDPRRIRPSAKGRRFLNDLLQEFLAS